MPVICSIITQLCYVWDLCSIGTWKQRQLYWCSPSLFLSISILWLKHLLISSVFSSCTLSLSLVAEAFIDIFYFFPANTACHIKRSHEQLEHTTKLRLSFRWCRKLENTREWLFRCHALKNSIQLTRKSLVLVLFLILPRSLVLLSFLSYFVLDIIS